MAVSWKALLWMNHLCLLRKVILLKLVIYLVDELRESKTNGKLWLANLENEERIATGIKSLKISYNKVFGYYIEVTKV